MRRAAHQVHQLLESQRNLDDALAYTLQSPWRPSILTYTANAIRRNSGRDDQSLIFHDIPRSQMKSGCRKYPCLPGPPFPVHFEASPTYRLVGTFNGWPLLERFSLSSSAFLGPLHAPREDLDIYETRTRSEISKMRLRSNIPMYTVNAMS